MIKSYLFILKFGLLLALMGITTAIGLIFYYSRDLPNYSQLINYSPPSVTRIYASDGKLIEEYAFEHRIFVPITAIPYSLIDAFVAAEDKNFFSHSGIDLVSIFRAAILNINNVVKDQRMQGGSTITQQVVKNFLLTSERSLARKIKEAILSYRISKIFSKEKILELYLNQIFLGQGSYGVASAAQNYFNKSVDELTISESAFIAALPKAPSLLNPEKNYNKAKERRDYVIHRMLEDSYISKEAAKEAIDTAIILQRRSSSENVKAHYYVEAVREEVIDLIGKEAFYTGGYNIFTPLDSEMQKAAQSALRKGIREYSEKHGHLIPVANIPIDNWHQSLNEIQNPASILEYKLGVVINLADDHAKIGLKDKNIVKISVANMKWAKAGMKSAKEILKLGDVVTVEKLADENYALRQIPKVNGGIVVIEPETGKVLAAEGGYDFEASKFNRVTQALRQPGSLSKTLVYLAALENGVQPNDIFNDNPVEISQGPGMPVWRPKNYKGDFLGPITMRTGLEKSRNLVTVRIAQKIGLGKVAEIIKRFGINDNPRKFYSMVLGSLETTLIKMTNAYGIIANGGRKISPHFIEMIKDRNGKVIYRRDKRNCINCETAEISLTLPQIMPDTQQRMITDDASSYQMTSMLTGAVDRGTAGAAKKLNKVIAGKTGTTNNSMDTWFIGYTPLIVVGTYVGYDAPKTLGQKATGSSVALPIFIDFMQNAYNNTPSLAFKVPDSINLINVNPKTGKRSSEAGSIVEAFKAQDIIKNEDELDPADYINPTHRSPDNAAPTYPEGEVY